MREILPSGFYIDEKYVQFRFLCSICSETNEINPAVVQWDGAEIKVSCEKHKAFMSHEFPKKKKRNRK